MCVMGGWLGWTCILGVKYFLGASEREREEREERERERESERVRE